MAASQFTIYSSSDTFGPGPINGLTGSLISILNACLVNGYAGKPAVGWSKTSSLGILVSDLSGSVGAVPSLGCYTPPSGSMFTMVVNDMGGGGVAPTNSSGGREALITGWENLLALTSSAPYTGSLGSGYGQFPLPTQLMMGNVVWRKSATADTTPRSWIMFADYYTMHLFIATGDTAGTYYGGSFGDVYSFRGSSDLFRCLLIGRAVISASGAICSGVATGALYDCFDSTPINTQAVGATATLANISAFNATPGHYMARTWGSVGGASINVSKVGDLGKAQAEGITVGANQYNCWVFSGAIQTPNAPDNSLYLAPIQIGEVVENCLRGRWRGMYHICHSVTSFGDGQVFAGSGDFAGKQFYVIRSGTSGGMFAVEISNTVETN